MTDMLTDGAGPDGRLVARLRRVALEALGPLLPEGPYALLDFPNHPNVGDSAIWLGERAALRAWGLPGPRIQCDIDTFDAEAVRARIGDAPILLHGGGNLGDLWPAHQELRERIVRSFPENRIVQLPQTIRFRDPAALERSREVLGAHPDLTLLVRDRASLATARRRLDLPARPCPDLALCLRPGPVRREPTREVVWLARSDHEADPALREARPGWAADWLDEEPDAWTRWNGRLTRRIARGAPPLGLQRRVVERTYAPLARRRLRRGLGTLAEGRCVVTDRLHGHVLCLLLGLPHVLLPDRFGKLRDFHRAWTTESRLARWADTVDEALAIARSLAARADGGVATPGAEIGARAASADAGPSPSNSAAAPAGRPLRLTVAICTRDRPDTLRDTLADLEAQRLPPGVEWEVLVVDNGSDQRTSRLLAAFADRLPLRPVREPEPGLSRARNRAVSEAGGDAILWTDDDVRVAPGWVAALVRALAREEIGLFGGAVRPRLEAAAPEWVRRAWPQVAALYAIREPAAQEAVRPDYVPFGANFAVRIDVQRRYRFDPALGRRGDLLRSGEEWDAVQRMLADGVRGLWVPDAVVEHRLRAARLTTAYVRELLRRRGEVGAGALRSPDGARGRVPLWLWKQAAVAEARYRIHRLVAPSPVWVRDLREASLARGRLLGCLRADGDERASHAAATKSEPTATKGDAPGG